MSEKILGLNHLGENLEPQGVSSGLFLSKIETYFLGFQNEEIRVSGKREQKRTAFPFWEG
jgi:hypothetical protein